MTVIREVEAWEVLDSRGDPTVRVAVRTSAHEGVFTVPSGASTGAHEAVERRDEEKRFDGKGVRSAVEAVNEELSSIVIGYDVTEQTVIDDAIVEYDGTRKLSAIGANATLGVSGAVLKAASAAENVALHRYLSQSYDREESLPLPMVNIISGGLHARGQLEIQDFLAVPTGADSYSQAIEMVWDVRNAVRARLEADGQTTLVADEGGFASPYADADATFELLRTAVIDAGYIPGRDVAFAIDVAASQFYDRSTERYELETLGERLDSKEMADLVLRWIEDYPLISVEDPLDEDDWSGWQNLSQRIPAEIQLLGDDLLVTNRNRLADAVERGIANAVLVKPNQAGTITRTIDVLSAAQRSGVRPVVSARSGETCDTTIADLAVGLDAGQIKIGSLSRSERLSKYNRLFGIERRIGESAEIATPFD